MMHRRLRLPLALLCLFLTFSSSFAQEVVFPLFGNSELQQAASSKRVNQSERRSASSLVQLPFSDDFSRQGFYPYEGLWQDSNVYVNPYYGENPPTIGVATFDGLNRWGNPYNINAAASQKSDYLTSQPVELGTLGPDTSAVWLSFYYQPQGLGDRPESGDSLVLQFLNNAGAWNNQWAVAGRSDTVFQRVSVQVRGAQYLYSGFQFRFFNYATVNGNRDHWHLDYVILNKNTQPNDSIRDNAFIRPQTSLLSEFSALPYSHYKEISPGTAAMRASISDTVHNLNYGPVSFTYQSSISDALGNTLFLSPQSSLSSTSNTYTDFTTSLNGFSFPAQPGDSADFLLKTWFGQPQLSNPYNDTNYYQQRFRNYYAYDDGSAELGYGVTGNADVWLAYQFDVKKADTLRGIQIHFNPTGVNIATQLIQIAYWDQLSVAGNTHRLVYKMINQRPDTNDYTNGFVTYLFDTLLVVQPGPAWIGFIQNNPQTLFGIGLDRNTDPGDKKFYHADGAWFQSAIEGAWLMRPLFGDTITRGQVIGIEELDRGPILRVFPNPSTGSVRMERPAAAIGNWRYELMESTGRVLRTEQSAQTGLFWQDLPAGYFLLRVTDDKGVSSCFKIVVSR